ncbi:MAG: AI-2E family transporter [Oscillospiraceae bacterium]|nr:AI-2E family transporter [Oscillospiraceae bacterium]
MKIEGKTCLKIGISVFLLYLCIQYWSAFTAFLGTLIGASAPLLIGCVIAYIVNILMSFYERHYFPKKQKRFWVKSRRPVCMIAAFLTLVVVVVLLLNIVIPELMAAVQLLLAQVPGIIEDVLGWLDSKNIVPQDLSAFLSGIDWKARLEQIFGVLTTGVGSVLGTAFNVVSSVFSGIVTALFAIIFSFYLLSGKEKLGGQFDCIMKQFMKDRIYTATRHVLSVMNDSFRKYLVGQCTEALILGVLCTVGMWIFKFPYAAMTGAVIAFTALIPVAGGYIGAAVGAFMILTVSPMKALLFLVYIVILQQLEGNLIYPRVVGSSMGLPGIWVLAAVTIGGGVMGVAGMLVGVPLAATAYRLLQQSVRKHKEDHKVEVCDISENRKENAPS